MLLRQHDTLVLPRIIASHGMCDGLVLIRTLSFSHKHSRWKISIILDDLIVSVVVRYLSDT